MSKSHKTLLEMIPQPAFLIDSEGCVAACNKCFADICGLPFENIESLKLDSSEWLDARSANTIRVSLKTLDGNSKWIVRPVHILDAEGKTLSADARLALLDDDNDSYYCLTILTDIKPDYKSASKRIESTSGISDDIWEWHIQEGRMSFSTAFKKKLGITYYDQYQDFEEWLKIIHPDDIGRITSIIQKDILESDDILEEKFRIRTVSGEYLWIFARGRVIDRDNASKPVRMVGTIVDITSQRIERDRLERREEGFIELINSIPVMVCAYDESGNIIFWNRECERVTGYKSDEFIKNPVALKMLYSDPDQAREIISRWSGVHINEPGNWECEIHCKDGSRRILSWSSIHTECPIPGWAAWDIGIDITEQEEAKTRLQNEKRLTHSILDTANCLIVCLDQKRRITAFNRELEKLTGYSESEVIGRDWEYIFIPDEYYKIPQDEFNNWVRKNPRDSYVKGMLTRNDEVRHIFWSNSAVFLPNDEFIAIAVGIDVTEHIEARKEIEKFQAISEIAEFGMALSDPDGKLTYVNEYMASLHGYTPDELIGKHFSIFQSPEQIQEAESHFEELLKKGRHKAIEVWHTDKSGHKFPLFISGRVLYGEDNKPEYIASTAIDLSQQKKAEIKLTETENRLRQMADAIDEVFWIFDFKAKKTIYVNPAFERTFGIPAEEFYEDTTVYLKVVHPDDKERVIKRQAVDNPESETEYRIIRPDGSLRWLRSRIYPIRNEKGDIYRLTGIVQDITEQKTIERDLYLSKERHRTLVESVQAGIAIVKRNGEFVFVNNKAAEALGKPREEVEGATMWELFPEEIARRQMRHVEEVIDTRTEFREEARVYLDGEWKYYDTLVQPFSYTDEDEIVAMIIASNVTDRREALEEIKEKEKRFRELADLLPQTVFETDLEGNVVFANQRGFELTGYSEEDIKDGLNAFSLFDGKDRDRALERFMLTIQGKDVHGAEYTVIRKNGTRFPVAIYSNPVFRNDEITGIRGILVDITDQKRVENEVRLTNETLIKERERLAKANIALEEILDKTEERTEKVKRQINSNLERVLKPYIKRLREKLPADLTNEFEFLVEGLNDITAPFIRDLEMTFDSLSPRELEVCNLIYKGLSSKEIAEQMSISLYTVQKHRTRIRHKLGIIKQKKNLKSFLKTKLRPNK